jgi:hypothetical protein
MGMLGSLDVLLCVADSPHRFGLAWSELKTGHIISSGEDTTVCKWSVPCSNLPDNSILRLYRHRDINAYSRLGNSLRPTQIFKCHDSCVNVSKRNLSFTTTSHE